MSSPGPEEKSATVSKTTLFFIFIWCVVFWNYYRFYPLSFNGTDFSGIFSEAGMGNLQFILISVLALSVYLYTTVIIGRTASKFLGYNENNINPVIDWFAVGNILLGSFILGLSLAGLLYRAVVFLIILLLLPLAGGLIKNTGKDGSRFYSGLFGISWKSKIYISAILTISLFIALNPTTESDALRYHVSIPDKIVQEHGLFHNSYNSFFQFPALIEMQFTYVVALFQETTGPKLIHWAYFLMTVLLLNRISQNFYPKSQISLVCAIFVSTPFIPIISGWAFIETALAFYVLFAFSLLFRLFSRKFVPGEFLVIGLTLGALLGIKYSMITVVPFVGIIALVCLQKKLRGKIGQRFLLLCLGAAVVSAPWFLKNYIYTGNPVYPLAYSVFDGENWSEENAKFYTQHAQSKGGLTDSNNHTLIYRITELLYLPIKATINPPGYALGLARRESTIFELTGNRMFLPDNFGDWQLGPIYLVFLPFVVFWFFRGYKRKNFGFISMESLICLFPVLYFVVWSQTYRDNRFLLPIIPFLCLGVGLVLINQKNKVILYLSSILIAYNSLWMIQTVLREHNPIPYLTGKTTQQNYLSSKLDFYRAYRELENINKNREPVMLIGEYRPLYLNMPNYTSDYFDTPVIYRLIHDADSLDEVKKRMEEMRIKYVLYNENELSKYLPDFTRHFQSERETEIYRNIISKSIREPTKKIEIYRDISEMEVNRIRKFMDDPIRDPRALYLSRI